ncbi:hypothetical protein PR048_019540 [Dryococelus australis]|uniref:C2H2-type domain-containing protein n=1 Tax=Dryococelus australis TaxID=614101 RepID=A0ABQ9H3V4_9NEOP|nr:hypothetical protein PR048_019540 [Dryococelus australis]
MALAKWLLRDFFGKSYYSSVLIDFFRHEFDSTIDFFRQRTDSTIDFFRHGVCCTMHFFGWITYRSIAIDDFVPSCALQLCDKCKHLFKRGDNLKRHKKNCKGRASADKKRSVLAVFENHVNWIRLKIISIHGNANKCKAKENKMAVNEGERQPPAMLKVQWMSSMYSRSAVNMAQHCSHYCNSVSVPLCTVGRIICLPQLLPNWWLAIELCLAHFRREFVKPLDFVFDVHDYEKNVFTDFSAGKKCMPNWPKWALVLHSPSEPVVSNLWHDKRISLESRDSFFPKLAHISNPSYPPHIPTPLSPPHNSNPSIPPHNFIPSLLAHQFFTTVERCDVTCHRKLYGRKDPRRRTALYVLIIPVKSTVSAAVRRCHVYHAAPSVARGKHCALYETSRNPRVTDGKTARQLCSLRVEVMGNVASEQDLFIITTQVANHIWPIDGLQSDAKPANSWHEPGSIPDLEVTPLTSYTLPITGPDANLDKLALGTWYTLAVLATPLKIATRGIMPYNSLKAVHDKMSTFEINLRKKPLLLATNMLTGALSDMLPVKLTTLNGKVVLYMLIPPPPKLCFVYFGSRVGIVPDDAAGRRAFSGISRFPRLCIPALHHTHFILIGSLDLEGSGDLRRHSNTGDSNTRAQCPIAHTRKALNNRAVLQSSCFPGQITSATGGLCYTRGKPIDVTTTLPIENYLGLKKGKLLVPLAEGDILGCVMCAWCEFGQRQCDVTSGMHFSRARSQIRALSWRIRIQPRYPLPPAGNRGQLRLNNAPILATVRQGPKSIHIRPAAREDHDNRRSEEEVMGARVGSALEGVWGISETVRCRAAMLVYLRGCVRDGRESNLLETETVLQVPNCLRLRLQFSRIPATNIKASDCIKVQRASEPAVYESRESGRLCDELEEQQVAPENLRLRAS